MIGFVAIVPFCSRLVRRAIREQKETEETKKDPIHVSAVNSWPGSKSGDTLAAVGPRPIERKRFDTQDLWPGAGGRLGAARTRSDFGIIPERLACRGGPAPAAARMGPTSRGVLRSRRRRGRRPTPNRGAVTGDGGGGDRRRTRGIPACCLR